MTVSEIEKIRFNYDTREQLKAHIYGRSEKFFSQGDLIRDELRSRKQIEAHQKKVKTEFLKCLGGLPPRNPELNARTTGKIAAEGYVIEKVIFQSRPQSYVTANLYLPLKSPGPSPAVLFLCGHKDEGKAHEEFQRACQILVQSGLIVLAIDPIGQGERLGYLDPDSKKPIIRCGVWEHEYAGIQCLPLGGSIARYFLHDAMSALDYLLTRPEVDSTRIGVTGNSGGGMQTSMLMLTDSRIAAAAPATFISSRRAMMWDGSPQDAEQIWPGFTAKGMDHEDILIAIAPKPVCVLAVTSDFFPIEGTRSTVERCRRIWKVMRSAKNLELVEDDSTHCFTENLALAATNFFNQIFFSRKMPQKKFPLVIRPASDLNCTRTGQVSLDFKDAEFVHAANRSAVGSLRKRNSKSEALFWIKKKVLRNRIKVPLNPRFYFENECEGLVVQGAAWWSQKGIFNSAKLFRNAELKNEKLPATIAIWNGGSARLHSHFPWIRNQCSEGKAVAVINLSGVGEHEPHSISSQSPDGVFGIIHKLNNDLVWMGDDLASLRVYDVLRSLDVIQQWPGLDPLKIEVFGDGLHGIYGLLAAFLDPRIKSFDCENGLESYRGLVSARTYETTDIHSILIPGVLEYFDIPDLYSWTKLRTRSEPVVRYD